MQNFYKYSHEKNAMEEKTKIGNELTVRTKNLIGSLLTELTPITNGSIFLFESEKKTSFSFAIVFALNNNWFPYRIQNKWNFHIAFSVLIAP